MLNVVYAECRIFNRNDAYCRYGEFSYEECHLS
jgi:hypothetical protein